jgi:ribosomal protein L37AE/L43A
MAENNDYTILDSLLGNLPTPKTLNEDTSAGVEPPPAISPSITVNNPPDNPIPGMQSATDKPGEAAPKFKCPKCISEAVATETKGKYKCSKCGQTFTVDEAVVKEEVLPSDVKEILQQIHDEADHIIGTEADKKVEVAAKNSELIKKLAKHALGLVGK